MLITGAARGIGTGIATALSEAGATVIVNSVTNKYLDAFVDKLQESNSRRVVPIVGDATDPISIAEIIAKSLAITGQIDVLVNNLGDSFGSSPFISSETNDASVSDQEIQKILSINLLSAIYCTREAAPHMLRRGQGNIINIPSFAAVKGLPQFRSMQRQRPHYMDLRVR